MFFIAGNRSKMQCSERFNGVIAPIDMCPSGEKLLTFYEAANPKKPIQLNNHKLITTNTKLGCNGCRIHNLYSQNRLSLKELR